MTITKEVFQGYVEELDITVIFEDVMNGEEAVSNEVKGYYYGKPDEEGMKTYYGKNGNIVPDKILNAEIFQVFSKELDMTIIFENLLDGKEVVSTAVRGFYYGIPDEEGMREYYGKMKIVYE